MSETLLQTQTLADSQVGTPGTLFFQQFDPSLGTLQSVVVSVTGDVNGSATIQNNGPIAASFTVDLSTNFSATTANGTYLATTGVGSTDILNLGTQSDTTGTAAINAIATAYPNTIVAGLAAYEGAGSFAVIGDNSVFSDISGGANAETTLLTQAGETISVAYNYTPAQQASGGGNYDGDDTTLAYNYDPNILIFQAGVTYTTSPLQIDTVSTALAGTEQSVAFDRFDPTLGSLVAIEIEVIGTSTGTVAAENLGSQPVTLNIDQQGSIFVQPGGSLTVGTTNQIATSVSLGAYDGTTDFAGTSGTIAPSQSASSNSGMSSLTDPALLAEFSGLGTVTVPVFTNGAAEQYGGGNMVTDLGLTTGGTVELQYLYEPQAEIDGSLAFDPVACFAAGTRIATPAGQVAIETLREGDTVLTITGQTREITWIGCRTINLRRHNAPEKVRPIRIARHAFGLNRPSRALHLSPDHAVYTDDVLIPVKHLVNGQTVTQTSPAQVTYYHLELSTHDVVLAENLPCETYLETGNRAAFDNGPVTDLHPDFAPRYWEVWQTQAYAPLCVYAAAEPLQRVQARLLSQARMLKSA